MSNQGTKREKAAETPLMKQYYSIRKKHPDAILLFRVGDFYETFEDDAVKASEILGITLTKRANGAASYVDLAGFPYHALETYLPKLVRAGQRVAICEQLEDPKMTKTIVKRDVTELVTPGVALNDNVLEQKENNFLACVYTDRKMAGVAFLDISTGEFLTSEGSIEFIDKLLQSFKPKEVLFEKEQKQFFFQSFGTKFYTFPLDEWMFNEDAATDRLLKLFRTKSLKGYGIQSLRYAITASGAIMHYLDLTQHKKTDHISAISRIEEDRHVWLDKFSINNLEIFRPIQENGKTLLDVLDKTVSPMGGRMLRRWVALPLKQLGPINDRHDLIEFLLHNDNEKDSIESYLKPIGDLERIVSKAAVGRINPREMIQLGFALKCIRKIKDLCSETNSEKLKKISERLNPCTLLEKKIEDIIAQDPPANLSKGRFINSGISKELDDLREIAYSGKDFLNQIVAREIQNTGISSLKIAFNNVFGYYIEVRNTHKDKVPESWIRKQTLVNAERYITEELKEYESKILGAEEKIQEIELKIFNDLIQYISDFISPIQLNASILGEIDCLISFTKVSQENNYCRPVIDSSDSIDIVEGRHPVIEKQLPAGEEYISNNIHLDTDNQQIMIITGPNMAGKSALLRQTALIVLLAQIGCFVPAKAANIGYVDKIFTRVGASDNISLGESTFMVEMNETASILNNLSDRSLILLDEIGRGTSTYDGISIAWAIVEFIHEHKRTKAKTLFATHYHELNKMADSFNRVKNYNVSVQEIDNHVLFLRKLKPGGTEHSFGIHVAKMAGMPKSIVERASKILTQFEKSHKKKDLFKPVDDLAHKREGYQLSFFQLEDPVLKSIRDEIANIDINNLTPIEALNKLNEIKKISGIK